MMKRRICAIVLSIMTAISMTPMTAFADGVDIVNDEVLQDETIEVAVPKDAGMQEDVILDGNTSNEITEDSNEQLADDSKQGDEELTIEDISNDSGDSLPEETEAIETNAKDAADEDATIVKTGTCGENATWELYSDGSLIIDGTGSISFNSTAIDKDSVKEICINDGIESIKYRAFEGFSQLTSIEIPNSVTSIGESAFAECSNLTSITLPSEITVIEDYTFSNCSSLTNIIIPDSVTSIGKRVFNGCDSLTSIHIPASVTSIEREMVGYCNSLKCITVEEDNPFYKSIEGVLFDKQGTTLYRYPSAKENTVYAIPNGVTDIVERAFVNCGNLISITIPEGVDCIRKSTFGGCTNLKSVNIPNGVKSIEAEAFYSCGLTSITIPEGVTSIGDDVFQYCYSLRKVTIPGSVVSIGARVFTIFGGATLYTVPHSYAADFFMDKYSGWTIEYLCDQAPPFEYSGTITDTIIMKPESTIVLTDYVKVWGDISEYTVKVSDESLYMYYKGEITNLSPGEVLVTVSKGGKSFVIRIITQEDETTELESISFKTGTVYMDVGTEMVNPITPVPGIVNPMDIIWESSNSSIVDVYDGLLTAVGVGNATVTAYSKANRNIKAKFNVVVTSPLHNIVPLKDYIVVEKGAKTTLSIYKYPYDTTDDIHFESMDPSIVTVDENGQVTGKEFGEAKVEITSGEIKKSVTVRVNRPLTGLSLDRTSVTLGCHETVQLNALFEPSDTTEKNVEWTSEDRAVATVDSNGIVTAQGKGFTYIYAISGDYSARCRIVCPDVSMTGIELPNEMTIEYGKEYSPELVFIPSTTTDNRSAEWFSSDESVFTVSDKGVVTATGLGTATLSVTVGEFTATEEITVTMPKGINVADLDYPEFSVKTYTGKALTPSFTAKYNGLKFPSKTTDAFDLVYSDNINAGTATITVIGKGDFTGTTELHFTIQPKSISTWTFPTFSKKTWDGKAKTPSFTCKDGSTKMVKGKDYTVTYSNNKNIGQANVVIKGKGNYTGTKKLYFIIGPKGTTLKSLTAQSKAFKVVWNKQTAKMPSSQITGYEIQWSTSSTFAKDNHTVKVKGASSSSKTINSNVWSGIKGGKKYYVRIRTYKSVKGYPYTSPWSAKKSITTKK